MRLVTKSEDIDFPYEKAKKVICDLSGPVEITPVDFHAMIEKGKEIGWTEEMIKENQALSERGNCFNFFFPDKPYLKGTLYENNILFQFYNQEHENVSVYYIQKWAEVLNLEIYA